MDPLLLLLLVLAVGVIIVLAVLLLRRRGQDQPQPTHTDRVDPLAAQIPLGSDPRTLVVGSVITRAGRDHVLRDQVVRGTLHLDEDGFTWKEHLIDDGADSHAWISVEEDPDLELVLWHPLDTEMVPGDKTLTHDSVTYKRVEHGRARYRSEGTTGLPATGTLEYYDYQAGDRHLSFERAVGNDWEVSLGEVLTLADLTIYGGDAS